MVTLSRPETERGQSPDQRADVRLRTPRVRGVTEPDGQSRTDRLTAYGRPRRKNERDGKGNREGSSLRGEKAGPRETEGTRDRGGLGTEGRRGSHAREPGHALAPRPTAVACSRAAAWRRGRAGEGRRTDRTLRKEGAFGVPRRTYQRQQNTKLRNTHRTSTRHWLR